MNKKLILFLVFLIPVVSALYSGGNLGTFEQNKCVDIKTILNTTSANISTISYPNTTIAVSDKAMTQNGKTFNYTFCSTNSLGEYIYDYFDAEGNVYVNSFTITPNGTEITTAKGIIYIVFILASLFVFVIVLYGAVKLPYYDTRDNDGYVIGINDLKYVKVFLIAMSYILFLFIIGLLRGITAFYVYEVGVYKFFNWIYWIMLSFLYPIIVCSFLFLIILFLQGKRMKKALERGIPTEA